jgi:hypothetical protein
VANAQASELDDTDLSAFAAAVHRVYDERLRADIHPLW